LPASPRPSTSTAVSTASIGPRFMRLSHMASRRELMLDNLSQRQQQPRDGRRQNGAAAKKSGGRTPQPRKLRSRKNGATARTAQPRELRSRENCAAARTAQPQELRSRKNGGENGAKRRWYGSLRGDGASSRSGRLSPRARYALRRFLPSRRTRSVALFCGSVSVAVALFLRSRCSCGRVVLAVALFLRSRSSCGRALLAVAPFFAVAPFLRSRSSRRLL
jgi:hypothetical protein